MIDEKLKELKKENELLNAMIESLGIKVLEACQCIYCGRIFDKPEDIFNHIKYKECRSRIK